MWPRDRFGNVVLVDPDVDPIIDINARGGEFTGPATGNLDGSYSRSLRYQAGAEPVVSLNVQGQAVISPTQLAPVMGIRYADRVVEFNPGFGLEQGDGRRRGAEASLGDVTRKNTDDGVSLGGLGSITVAINQRVMLEEITVFVVVGDRPKPFLVEVLPAHGSGWVQVGTFGVTNSFSLDRLAAGPVQEVRITDRSAESDGVKLLGVGSKQTGPESGGCMELIKRILTLGRRSTSGS